MMTKVKALEKEVAKLSRKELDAFRAWFEEYDAKMWDKQIEEDAASGKLDKLFEKSMGEHRAGKTKEI